MTTWPPGTQIMWRYGEPGLDVAAPMTVVQDDDRGLVAWLAAGTPVQRESVWEGHSVLGVHLPGRAWSVWVFFAGDTGEFEGWYVTIEDPHVRIGRTTWSRDHVLDLWVEPDRTHARLDEDELVLAVEQGRYTQADADAITRVADEVERVLRAWGSPFRDGWETFRPDPAWPVPVLAQPAEAPPSYAAGAVGQQTQTHHLSFAVTEVRKRYVSWDRGEADREWACLTLLADRAPGLAPRPIRRELDGGAPVVVMQRLPGVALGRGPLTHDQTTSLAATLRRLYDVPLDAIVDAGITERGYGPSTLPQALTDWLSDSYDLSPCQDPALVRAAVESAVAWLDEDDRLPVPHLVALGIADLNPANILWDGRTCRLVDFEDAGLTDPAYELADHAEHLAGRLSGVFDVDALVDAVGLCTDQRERMRAYRPLWATFWLAMLLPGNGGFRRNPAGTTEDQARRVLEMLGVRS